GHTRVKPSVYLRPMAQPISNSPATTRMTHAICTHLKADGVVPVQLGAVKSSSLPILLQKPRWLPWAEIVASPRGAAIDVYKCSRSANSFRGRYARVCNPAHQGSITV